MSDLTGKVAVVLGASGEKNFGSEISRRFARAGARVVVAGRRAGPLQALAAEIGGLAVATDITREAQLENLFKTALDEYGRVDIAVNSSGGMANAPIAELDADSIRPTLEVSFIGTLLFFKHAAAVMVNGGSVITISSLTARRPPAGYAVYAGARAGIDYAMQIAAVEYGAQGVRFNSIAAGLIETDMTAAMFQMPELVQTFTEQIPVGRMGTVEDVAEAVLWLADDKTSGFINGQILDVSGGQAIGKM